MNNQTKMAIRNFVNHNTYEKFKDVVGTRLVDNSELKQFASELYAQIREHVSTTEAAVHRLMVDYFLSEFGAQALGADCKVDMHAHDVDENAWKKYRPRRPRNKKQQ